MFDCTIRSKVQCNCSFINNSNSHGNWSISMQKVITFFSSFNNNYSYPKFPGYIILYVLCSFGVFLDLLYFRPLLRYCYLHIVQQKLDEIKGEWNIHMRRGNNNQIGGIPNVLYNHPQLQGNRFSVTLCI